MACRSKGITATAWKISARSRVSSASFSEKLRTRFRAPPTCAASSSISLIRSRGAHSAPTSRETFYEGLLEKNAQDTKSGAGQYFTPRVLIDAIVTVMRPQPGTTIIDPAAGTGGFLLSAASHILKDYKLDRDQVRHLQAQALYAVELVASTARLCAMNLLLHGLGNEKNIAAGKDSLAAKPSVNYDMVLTNPPFGKKSSVTIINTDGDEVKGRQEILRDDFWATTGNKQLNFLQHVLTILKPGGRAAIVLPDNCLFADQAGEVFQIVTEDCDLHTVLRLPRGTFTSTPTSFSSTLNGHGFAMRLRVG